MLLPLDWRKCHVGVRTDLVAVRFSRDTRENREFDEPALVGYLIFAENFPNVLQIVIVNRYHRTAPILWTVESFLYLRKYRS
jgi:hypothetical protein